MKYRGEIDGLRALAVIPVVLFHAGFPLTQGGFVGVDIFFVISGYLISHIIVAEGRAGTFSLGRFYERRARRILPALFAVCLASLPPALLLLLPHQLKDFGQSLFATNLFASNVFFILETDYFNEFAHYSPLLHTWSLSVEEQFYVLFPLVIMALLRVTKRDIAPLLLVVGLAAASFVFSLAIMSDHPVANFYLMPTRAWQLLAGATVALVEIKSGRRDRPAAAWLGFFAIVVAIVAFTPATPSPSPWSLLPVGGTALILLFGGPTTGVGKLLSKDALKLIGLMSYSLYLVHQPVLAFARVWSNGHLGILVAVLCVGLTFVLGWLSWKFVEVPLRGVKWSRRVILGSGAAVSIALAGVGYSLHKTKGLMEWQVSRTPVERRVFVVDQEALASQRKAVWRQHLPTSTEPFDSTVGRTRVLILGDSKAEDLYVSAVLHDSLFQEYSVRRLALDDACMEEASEIAFTSTAGPVGDCKNSFFRPENQSLLIQADVVVLTASWQAHTVGEAVQFVRKLVEHGKPAVVVSTANFNDVPSLAMGIARGRASVDSATPYFFRNIRSDWQQHSDALARQVRDLSGVRYVEKLEAFCDFTARTCELFTEDGVPYIFDTGHVTLAGAERFARHMQRAGWFRPQE